jgi:hypothetical protein
MGADELGSILCRVFDLADGEADANTARTILKFKFKQRDVARVNKLSALARVGKLTDDQRAELEGYLTVGDVLAVLHSKARVALKREAAPAPRRVRRKAS